MKVRRHEFADDSIHQSQVESDKVIADVSLAMEQSKTLRFVRDDVTKREKWKKSLVINAVGAVATFKVLTVFNYHEIMHGAWLAVVIIPLPVLLFTAVDKHYVAVATQFSTQIIHKNLEPINYSQ